MDDITKRLSNYISEKGISITQMSKKLEIPYYSLFRKLTDENSRGLLVQEYFDICGFLEIDPRKFLMDENV